MTSWTAATRLLYPWDFPGKNTGVGCHSLLQGDLPDPEIEPTSLRSLALADGFFCGSLVLRVSLVAQLVKNLPAMQETLV